MSFGLTTRVVLTVVLLAVGVVALDAFVTRWAFQTRFLNYISEQEQEQLQFLADALSAYHLRGGDLRELADRGSLLRLMRGALPPGDARRPPHHEGRPRPDAPARGDGQSGHREHAARRQLMGLVARLRLELADGSLLVYPRGRVSPRIRLLTQEVVADGDTIATLFLVPAREFARERDRRFSRDHLATIWWIALAAAVLASLVGWALARRLIAPVQAVAAGARTLADGDFDVSLDASRRDELGALARDFNRLAQTLAATSRARERWVADVAHELRTPVAVLRAEVDAIRDGVRPLGPDALTSFDAEIDRLARLIDDLRDLTLADAGALAYSFATTDLAALVDGACSRFRPRMEDAGLTLEWTAPEVTFPCQLDPERIDQLLANLLENALRYTDAPGPVRVQLTTGGARARIRIEDGPPGVAAEELPHLFERFHRVDSSRARALGGAGLGLAIAERIVAAHGGSLAAAPSQLGGLCVDVDLPMGAAA